MRDWPTELVEREQVVGQGEPPVFAAFDPVRQVAGVQEGREEY